MLGRLRKRLTYANVMATIAVFIALGGSGYAALSIGSNEIRDDSIRSRDVKKDALTGADIRENKLRGVRSAKNSKRLGGKTLGDLRDCPDQTLDVAGACVEAAPRPATTFYFAAATCNDEKRRLATFAELNETINEPKMEPADGGEWTSDVAVSGASPGPLRVVVLELGGSRATSADSFERRQYRCLAYRGKRRLKPLG